jgi:hypothetical protein
MDFGEWLGEDGFVDTGFLEGIPGFQDARPRTKGEQLAFLANAPIYMGTYGAYQAITGRGGERQLGIDDEIARAGEAGAGELNAGIDGADDALGLYNEAGQQATQQQQALMGLLGPQAQQEAYAMIENSPAFAAQLQTGEEAILQNAAATGGLRGGNTQSMLAQFRPQLLDQLIQQQLGGLSGLSGQGLGAAGQFAGIQAGLRGDLAGLRSGVALSQIDARRQREQEFRDSAGTLFGLGANIATGGASGAFSGIGQAAASNTQRRGF